MTAIPNNDATDNDGWVSMFVFQKDGVSFTTYNYFKGTEYEPGTGWPYGSIVANISKGQWVRVTIRLKINDPDKSNGIYEVYNNDVLIYQQTDAKIVNSIHPEYLIESIYLNSFFGGSGSKYASPKEQYMRFDNLTAFYFPKSSSEYRAGASEKGRKLSVPAAKSYHPQPPNCFTPTVYTMAKGSIVSHCGFYIPAKRADVFQTSSIQVAGATALTINVNNFTYDGGINYLGNKQILNIYSGTGTSKILQKTFMNGTYTTVPTTIKITGNSATIEWQSGSGIESSFLISYTSNGTGSGKNYECGNFVAKQSTATQSAILLVTTGSVTSITQTTASCGGNINYNNATSITARGVCWGTTPNPTTANDHTSDGTGTGTFTSSITGLPGTLYYVRAFATTSSPLQVLLFLPILFPKFHNLR
jgi:hypothetical protein